MFVFVMLYLFYRLIRWEVILGVAAVVFAAMVFRQADISAEVAATKRAVVQVVNMVIKEECSQTKHPSLPLKELRKQLKMNVVGQSLAIEIITNNLEMFVASRSSRPLVLWLSGPEGSGKTLTISLISNVLAPMCRVQAMYSSLLPQSDGGLKQEAASFLHKVDPCIPNLLLIDDWDGESSTLFFLKLFLLGLLNDEKLRGSSILVVLSGTTGGQEVAQYFHGPFKILNTGSRDFTKLSIALQKKYSLDRVTPLAVLVPFFPLNAEQIKMCVTRELLVMQRWDLVMDEAVLTIIQERVLNQTQLESGRDPPVAAHGCKRVIVRLSLLLPSIQHELELDNV